MSKINKVLYNVNQRDSDPSKGNTREDMWMARNNIGLDEVIGHATVTENNKEYKGIAPLGTNGLVPVEFLPSFVNEVVNGYYYNGKFYQEAAHTTEISPDANTTYVDITVADVGVGYRWTQESGYFQISNQNAFGAIQAFNGSTAAGTIHADQPMDILQVKGSQGIKVGAADTGHMDALTIEHTNQVTAGTIGSSSASSGNSIAVPYANYDANGHITGKGTHTHTIPTANTDGEGVVQLQNSIGANETNATKAATPKSVRDAINNLNYSSVGGAGKYIQTISESNGVISATVETMDTTPTANSTKAITSGAVQTALASKSGTGHVHGNITSDGKVTTAAQTKKTLLVTNNNNEVVTGPAFGTATGDDTLVLNKEGNWVSLTTPVTNAINGLNYSSVGGAGKYIQAISESNGVISATVETMDTVPTANSTKAITSGAVQTALASKSGTGHVHGNITSDGKVGSTSGKPLITTTDGVVTTGEFGESAGKFAEGNHTHTLSFYEDSMGTGDVTLEVGNVITVNAGGSSKKVKLNPCFTNIDTDPIFPPKAAGAVWRNYKTGDIWIANGVSLSNWILVHNRIHDLIVQRQNVVIGGQGDARYILCDKQKYTIDGNGNTVFERVDLYDLAKWKNRGDVINVGGEVAYDPWGDGYPMRITEYQASQDANDKWYCTNLNLRGYKYDNTTEGSYWGNINHDDTTGKDFMEFTSWG